MTNTNTQRTLFAVDVQNLFYSCRDIHGIDARLDYRKLLHTASYGSPLHTVARAYVVGKHDQDDSRFVLMLSQFGYSVQHRLVGESGGGWDAGIIADTLRDGPEFDRVVIASGDGHFAGMMKSFHVMGKHTAVIAFKPTLSNALHDAVDNVTLLDKSMLWGRR